MQLEKCIFFQLSKASQNSQQFLCTQIADLGLTPTQAMVINVLSDGEKIIFRQLARRLRVTGATLTGVIDRLEQACLVDRQTDREDRRSICIRLTPGGREMASRLEPVMEMANAAFLQTLPPGEQGLLRMILNRLISGQER